MKKSCLPAIAVLVIAAIGEAQQKAGRLPPSLCAGQVSHKGKPVEGAEVHVLWIPYPELPGSLVLAIDPNPRRKIVAKTKARGRYRIGLPNHGPFAVFARMGKLRSSLIFPVMAGDFHDLKLETIPMVEGRVVDAEDKPVVGANVSSASFSDHGSYLEKYRHPRPSQSVKTDAAGIFHLPVWATAERPAYNLRSLRAWTGDLMSEDRFYLVSGQSECDADLHLTRRTTFRARVQTSNGEPIVDASVTDVIESGRSVRSDEQGRFAFEGLHSGALLVQADGFQRQRITWPRGSAAPAPLIMQPGLSLGMRLVRDGSSLEGHRVVVASPIRSLSHLPWRTKVGKDGALRIKGLSKGTPVSAFVEMGGRFVQFLSHIPNQDQQLGEIHIDDSRAIFGQVNDLERRPIAGARVILQPDYSVVENAGYRTLVLFRVTYTDRGGRFRFDGVLGGKLTLGINANEDGFRSMRLSAKAGDTPIVVSMEKGCVITGQVLNEAGKPAPGASVQYLLRGTWGSESARFKTCYLRAVADEEGRFRFRGVPKHTSFTSFAMFTERGKGYWSLLSGSYAADAANAALAHKLTVHSGRYPR